MQAELRNKSFELSHVRMVLGEKEGLLGQAGMQVELLQEKMQVGLPLVLASSLGFLSIFFKFQHSRHIAPPPHLECSLYKTEQVLFLILLSLHTLGYIVSLRFSETAV